MGSDDTFTIAELTTGVNDGAVGLWRVFERRFAWRLNTVGTALNSRWTWSEVIYHNNKNVIPQFSVASRG